MDTQKVEHKYGFGAGSRSAVNPPHDLGLDIDGTEAREGVDPQKVQHKYASGAGLWDKMFSFEDKIVFLVLKTITARN